MISLAGFGRTAAAEPPEHLWSRAFTATPVDTFTSFVGVMALNPTLDDGVVVVGAFHGAVDFGGGVIESRSWSQWGETVDVYGVAFDAAGNHRWSRVLARIRNQGARRLSAAIDQEGAVVVAGAFRSIDIDGTSLASGFSDAFATRFDSDGAYLWSRKFGISGVYGNGVDDVAIDAHGDIVLAGTMSGRMDFGGGVVQSAGGFDVFVVRLDPFANHVWSRRFGGTGLDESRFVAIDGQGRIAIAGRFPGNVDFGGGPLNGDYDEIFLAVFSEDAAHVWSRSLNIGSPGGFNLYDLAASDAGEIAFACSFGGSIDLGSEVLYGSGYVAARYSLTGAQLGSFATNNAYALNVLFDPNESVIVSGVFSEQLVIDDVVWTSRGAHDGYLARFGADWDSDWVLQVGGAGDDGVRAFASSGDVLWLAGGFDDGIDFGDTEYPGRGTFFAKVGPAPPEPVFDVSLFSRASAIEVRWSIASEQPLDSVAIVRVAPPAPEEITVYATEFGSGVGSFIDRNVIGGRSYRYRLTASTTTGGEYRSGDVSATVPVFANQLAQNAPNPFNPATTIVYSLSQRASVAVSIFDVTGVPIRRIEQGVRDAGEYAVEWDGRDDAGIVVGTGVYFYRLDGVTGVTPKKMVLLK